MAKSPQTERDTHPSQDHTDRFALDRLLRAYGWRIVSRPRRGEPTWRQASLHLRQSQALEGIDARVIREARKRQLSYWRRVGLSD
jgi:hypothetical protein